GGRAAGDSRGRVGAPGAAVPGGGGPPSAGWAWAAAVVVVEGAAGTADDAAAGVGCAGSVSSTPLPQALRASPAVSVTAATAVRRCMGTSSPRGPARQGIPLGGIRATGDAVETA